MSLEVTSLSELTSDLVIQNQEALTQLLAEEYPEIDMSRGVIHDLLAYLSAVFGAKYQTELSRYLASRSLKQISEDPDSAYTDAVDDVLSNFRVERKTGAASTGTITVVVSENSPLVISTGYPFQANGVDFYVEDAYAILQAGSTNLGIYERALTPLQNGTYAFTIPAVADVIGEAGNIKKGLRMTPTVEPANFVTAYAASDFIGGVDTETNEELITRFETGIAARAWSNRTNIEAMIKDQTEFQNTVDYSVIGYGDAEMIRDQHWIFPVSGGGRTDVYARTSPTYYQEEKQLTATLIELQGGKGVWQVNIDRDEFPGFYTLAKILNLSDSEEQDGFAIINDVRSFDLTDVDFAPDIESANEAAYSMFQTASIQFLDTATVVSSSDIGTTQDYKFTFVGMPLIKDLQEFCSSRDVRGPASDILIKAAVPCFTSINVLISKPRTTIDPDEDAIKESVATYINNLGFVNSLYASGISDVIKPNLRTGQLVNKIEMLGQIRRPTGTWDVIRDTHQIDIPYAPEYFTTSKTTVFIITADDISISFETIN